jgi:chromosomal replication initiator protein
MRAAWWDSTNNREDDLWIRDIIAEVADQYGVTPAQILSPGRKAQVTKARRCAMWRARQETNSSYLKLARIFNRDHSTVIYNVRKHDSTD